ncbi:MAG: DedA family protein [Candidatus Doudnabacteria bacterium]|nr:DedA family protein [Candidatus Doudnabacteria bacterium]
MLQLPPQYLRHGHTLHSQILYYSEHWHTLGYVFIALGIFIEGDAVLFTAGFLTHQGLFHPVLAFLWLLAGGVIGDLVWYKIGAYLQGKDNRIVRWLKKITDPLAPHLLERPKRSLFLSKFLYGVNHAILCKAGALGLPLKQFMVNDLPGNIAWILIVGGLGYASSAGIVQIGHSLRYAEIGLLVGIVLVTLLSRFISRFLKKIL